jgi:hypothetical protein
MTRQSRRFATGRCGTSRAILLLSCDVSMFLAGDEVRRTQNGNNPYCQVQSAFRMLAAVSFVCVTSCWADHRRFPPFAFS